MSETVMKNFGHENKATDLVFVAVGSGSCDRCGGCCCCCSCSRGQLRGFQLLKQLAQLVDVALRLH